MESKITLGFFLLSLTRQSVVLAQDECSLVASVGENLSASFTTDKRGRVLSLEKIEVRAYYEQLVEGGHDCPTQLKLYHVLDGYEKLLGERRKRTDRERKREPFFRWFATNIIPCQENTFRLEL